MDSLEHERKPVQGLSGQSVWRRSIHFMHDLESFFWVLFWICIHFDGPNQEKIVPRFDIETLADEKKGLVTDKEDFIKKAEQNFTLRHQALITWVNRLRKMVIPNGRGWQMENKQLYCRMNEILRKAQTDPMVLEE